MKSETAQPTIEQQRFLRTAELDRAIARLGQEREQAEAALRAFTARNKVFLDAHRRLAYRATRATEVEELHAQELGLRRRLDELAREIDAALGERAQLVLNAAEVAHIGGKVV